ncbi:hypothetical protein SAMN04487992_12029 [Cellulophaga baltica]|uniref:Uncharacterized protein n=1 Tax=Cellulophaga baltica TaxID=76594 RepID=A0A1G7LQR5_9FLAO|nr:hypothetical protein SAMN04487992_12029 [Cellulophaga baltica]
MNKFLKGNIYTDILWLIIGIAGGVYYYTKNSYWSCGIFLFVAFLYIIKLFTSSSKKTKT